MARGFSLIELMMAVAIVGIFATLALPNYRYATCKVAKTEALEGLKGIAALEEGYRAEHDGYASVSMICASPVANSAAAAACMSFALKGKQPAFVYSATATATTYTASATGVRGTRMEGALWQLNQAGVLTDVTGLCRTPR